MKDPKTLHYYNVTGMTDVTPARATRGEDPYRGHGWPMDLRAKIWAGDVTILRPGQPVEFRPAYDEVELRAIIAGRK